MNTITYKGKEYLTRTFNVIVEPERPDGGYKSQYTIAPESLVEDMGMDNILDESTNEYFIDQSIYYYVEDEVFDLSGEEICANYLDVPMQFISEET